MLEDEDLEDKENEVSFEIVGKGFHSGGISCMDISVQRPILVTASKDDCTIRFWNYYTGQCELQRSFIATDKDKGTIRDQVKPLLTVALHPSGYYMAAGFVSCVLVMHVLHNELKTYK